MRDQSQQLDGPARDFVAAYESGDDAKARTLYPHAAQYWERIEPVAESFGDLDPKMDLREADLEQGQKWTGWHRIEKDLWPPAKGYKARDAAGARRLGSDLLANTTLDKRVQTLNYTVDQIGNGSKSLLDEVASGKITGEEDIWSHTDLYDFQANVDGARVAYEGLKPILDVKDPALSTRVGAQFDALQKVLDRYRPGQGRLRLLRQGHPGPAQAALRRRQRAGRAALPDDGGHHPVTARRRPRPDEPARARSRAAGCSVPPAPARSRPGRRGSAATPSATRRTSRRTGSTGPAYPFEGEHQAGIVTPAQDRLHFAAFDVTTDSRERADRPCSRPWTAAARAMTAGRAGRRRRPHVVRRAADRHR